MEKLEKKKLKKKLKKSDTPKILWDDSYGDQPIFRPLGDLGKPSEKEY